MCRLTVALLSAASLTVLAACAKPIRLRVDVPNPAAAATVNMRLTEGKEAAEPVACSAPCDVSVSPDTTHELSVHAPGYYPAVMLVTYEHLRLDTAATGQDDALLMVPLQQRPAAPGGSSGAALPGRSATQ